jgi:hypothetical protein
MTLDATGSGRNYLANRKSREINSAEESEKGGVLRRENWY